MEEQRQKAIELAQARLKMEEEEIQNTPLFLNLDGRRVFVVKKIGSGGQGDAYLVKGYNVDNFEGKHVVKKVLLDLHI